MGIESFLTASAVDCVVAQRLARKLCTSCKRRSTLGPHVLAEAGFRYGADLEVWEGRLSPLLEHRLQGPGRPLLRDAHVRARQGHGRSGAPEAEIANTARQEGMLTLREDRPQKVRMGATSLEEVVPVTT